MVILFFLLPSETDSVSDPGSFPLCLFPSGSSPFLLLCMNRKHFFGLLACIVSEIEFHFVAPGSPFLSMHLLPSSSSSSSVGSQSFRRQQQNGSHLCMKIKGLSLLLFMSEEKETDLCPFQVHLCRRHLSLFKP